MGTLYTNELSALAQRSVLLQEQRLCHFQEHIWCGYFLILDSGVVVQGRTRKQNHFIHCNSCAPKILLASQVYCYCLEILFCLTTERKKTDKQRIFPLFKASPHLKKSKTNKQKQKQTVKLYWSTTSPPASQGLVERLKYFYNVPCERPLQFQLRNWENWKWKAHSLRTGQRRSHFRTHCS